MQGNLEGFTSGTISMDPQQGCQKVLFIVLFRLIAKMTSRLTLHKTHRQPKENPLIAVVKKEVFKELEGILATAPGTLERTYKKLSKDLKEIALLERLFADNGDDVLLWLPEMLKFPDRKKVATLFFVDARLEDTLLEEDESYGIEDPDAQAHQKDFDEVIAAKEKLRLPKAVAFFWLLARREGKEKAKMILEMTLATIALYKLLTAKVLTKQKILNSAMFEALPPEFQNVLIGYGTFEVKLSPSRVREDVAARVSLEMAEASDRVIEGLVKQAHEKLKEVMGGEATESREVQYFALELLKTSTFVHIANEIIEACPPVKK